MITTDIVKVSTLRAVGVKLIRHVLIGLTLIVLGFGVSVGVIYAIAKWAPLNILP